MVGVSGAIMMGVRNLPRGLKLMGKIGVVRMVGVSGAIMMGVGKVRRGLKLMRNTGVVRILKSSTHKRRHYETKKEKKGKSSNSENV